MLNRIKVGFKILLDKLRSYHKRIYDSNFIKNIQKAQEEDINKGRKVKKKKDDFSYYQGVNEPLSF